MSKETSLFLSNDLKVAILDDDTSSCFIRDAFYCYYQSSGKRQPKPENIVCTDDCNKFIRAAEYSHILITDPGPLGQWGMHGVKFREDQKVYKFLKERPSKTLYVRCLLPRDHYSFDTFELPNVEFWTSEFSWHVCNVIEDWLFINNPLALFCPENRGLHKFIPKLKKPLAKAIAAQLGLSVQKEGLKQIRDLIWNYYIDAHNKDWERDKSKRKERKIK